MFGVLVLVLFLHAYCAALPFEMYKDGLTDHCSPHWKEDADNNDMEYIVKSMFIK